MASTQKISLLTKTNQGSTTTGDAAILQPRSGAIMATLIVSAASGTSPTLDAKVQHSPDGTNWFDLMTFTQATAATTECKSHTGPIFERVRAVGTIGGTTPQFSFTVDLWCDPKGG